MSWKRVVGSVSGSALLALSLGCGGGKGAVPKEVAEVPRTETPPPDKVVPAPEVEAPERPADVKRKGGEGEAPGTPLVTVRTVIEPQPIAPFVEKGLVWLAKAQHKDGGWGAGSHANQQEKDPHKVLVDPATTAFTACAFLRAGHTLDRGAYKDNVRRATEYLIKVVDAAPQSGPRITDLTGTQIQSKLGETIDTAMAMHFFVRLLPNLPKDDPLAAGVNRCIDKCLAKLQASQAADGGWGQGSGWAPVLQSSLNCSSLELAQSMGRKVDEQSLDRARAFQKGNVNARTGAADASKGGAGVELYAYSGGQRAGASEARAAKELVDQAKAQGKVAADAPVNADSIGVALSSSGPQAEPAAQAKAGKLYDAYQRNEAVLNRLDDERLLSGFGNNGGEEFLSYMLTSESLIIAGGEKFPKWNAKLHERLAKVQNADGTWSGSHCITSPVFCTAAVAQCLTADHDAEHLIGLAEEAAKLKAKAK